MRTEQTAPEPPPPIALTRTMGVRDLVLFNLVAVIGLRWLATSAQSGPSALTLWVLAAVLFFIPSGLAVNELSTLYPSEGGIYAWTRRRFGEGHGFFCGWCYWIVNVLYYPQILISCAAISTFIFGKGRSGLADSWPYVLTLSLILLWVAVWFNIVGLSVGKWLENFGGMGTYLAGVIVVALGIYAFTTRPSANPITWSNLVPNFNSLDTVNLWASIAFAFTGLELAATLGGEIKDPRRTFPRAVYLSAPLIAGCYLIGTMAMLWIIPVKDINIVTGVVQSVDVGARHTSVAQWLAPIAAAAYTLGIVGGVGAWLTGPARVAFVIGLDKYFPPSFGRIHPKWKTPYVAILWQAILASIILLLPLAGKGTGVEDFYLIILDAQLLIYFVPFIYLFACILLDRPADRADRATTAGIALVPGGRVGRAFVGLSGLFVTLFAMVVAVVARPANEPPLRWFLEVFGGAVAFYLIGLCFYWSGRRHPAK
jgi:amino acid transporter